MNEETVPVTDMTEAERDAMERQRLQERILDSAFDAFDRNYRAKHPMPVAPSGTLLRSLDIEFWIGLVQGTATIFLNGVRTGSAFYSAAIKIPGMESSLGLGKAEAIAAVFSYELLLLMYGISHGKKHVELSRWLKWLSLSTAFITVTIAGLWVSSLIDTSLEDWTNGALIALMISMAFASILALASGEILGVAWAQARQAMSGGHSNYLVEVKAWEEARDIAWGSEKGYWVRKFTPRKAPTLEKSNGNGNGNGHHGEGKKLIDLILDEYDRRGMDPRVDSLLPHTEVAKAIGKRVGKDVSDNSVSITLKRWLERQPKETANNN